MNDQHSFFLVIEGLDGSGKSEISRRLAELMRSTLDDRVMLTFEPHDPSAAGLYIRRVLRKKIVVSSHTLALAFALNRSDHNERVIEPFLEQNTGHRVVLCDRYVLSSLVYNTSYDLPMRSVWDLNSGARRPDLTLFLDASAEICYARMGSRGGNRELFETNLADSRSHYFEAIEFLRQQGEQVLVIDANPDLLVVINSIIDALKVYGPRWLTLQKLMFLEATAPAMLTPPPLELDRWIRDFIERYTPAALAEAVYDDGIRRLVAAEVNNLPLDELAALMMNFLQTDRRYRFESAWPGQPIDYTVIRPSGESGGLVILQDERRWEGVMRALESEFIAPHYSIRRDAIQFVVALDPSHAGEEVTQFVPDTGSVPVEVYGRGTLIQYFTRYVTRRVSADNAAVQPTEPPQMPMPLPEDSEIDADWSLAAALGTPGVADALPAAPSEPLAADAYLPATEGAYEGQEQAELAAEEFIPADEAWRPVEEGRWGQGEAEMTGDAEEAPAVAYYAEPSAGYEAPAEYAFVPLPEADESFAAYYAEPEAESEAGAPAGDYPYVPAPEAEGPYDVYRGDLNAWVVPETQAAVPAPEAVFEDEGGALPTGPATAEGEVPYDAYAADLTAWAAEPAAPEAETPAPAPVADFEDEGGALPSDFTAPAPDPFASLPQPAPDEEVPWHRRARTGPLGRRDSGEHRAVAPGVHPPAPEPEPFSPPPAAPDELSYDPNAEIPWRARHRTGPLGRRDTAEHKRAAGPDAPSSEPNLALDPFSAPEPLAADDSHAGGRFEFELPNGGAEVQADVFAGPPVSQEEMDAIAALYTGLDDALRARSAERAAPAAPDEEPVEGEEERG